MARVRIQTPTSARSVKRVSANFDDSPSRQLMLDLERALGQVHLHEVEMHKVHAYDRRVFKESLDLRDARRTEEDVAALDAATARHERVRKEAEAELQRYLQEIAEQERLIKQEEQKRWREEQARTKAEAENKAREEAERMARIEQEKAAATKAAEDQARAEEAKRQKREDTLAREKAEEERKQERAQEAAKAKQKAEDEKADRESVAREAATRVVIKPDESPQSQGQSFYGISANGEAKHQKYLVVHQNLKRFRKEFWAECKKDANLKSKVGDMRRAMRTSVGQLTEARGANKLPTERIKSTLKDAMTIPSPPLDIRDYFAVPPSECQSFEQSKCPSLLVYVLNMFSKAIISQFSSESGISIKAAEPAGVLVAQIFATPEYQFEGHSLIDILLAKFHFACPVLWGVYGDEQTPEGRSRIGWRREANAYVSETRQYERVAGLGAGFASIALRNFSKSRLQNPFPPTNFWECLANILNIPPHHVQPTHLFVLRAMLENSVDRFIQAFGSAAIAALRLAMVDFPAALPTKIQETSAVNGLLLLKDVWAQEKNLRIG